MGPFEAPYPMITHEHWKGRLGLLAILSHRLALSWTLQPSRKTVKYKYDIWYSSPRSVSSRIDKQSNTQASHHLSGSNSSNLQSFHLPRFPKHHHHVSYTFTLFKMPPSGKSKEHAPASLWKCSECGNWNSISYNSTNCPTPGCNGRRKNASKTKPDGQPSSRRQEDLAPPKKSK